jgi:aldose 1-epimerase
MTGGKNLVCLLAVVLLAVAGDRGAEARKVGKESVVYYELRRGEFSMVLTNWGATILSVRLPDKNGDSCFFLVHQFPFDRLLISVRFFLMAAGKIDDVVLGYKSIGSYVVSLNSLYIYIYIYMFDSFLNYYRY